MSGEIKLSIVTPNGKAASVTCDSVRMTAQDDVRGRNGGGLGIHPGHASAMIALEEGILTALLDGTVVLKVNVKPGFAAVRNDVVTVLTEHADIMKIE